MHKTCFLFGHSDAPLDLTLGIEQAMEDQILQHGVTQFIVGHYGNFDRMAISAGKSVKARHPDITLLLLIPYHPAERPLELPRGFDASFYPPNMEFIPKRLAIVKANQYMVATADSIICYVNHPGHSRALLESVVRRVKRTGIPLRNLAPANPQQPPTHTRRV